MHPLTALIKSDMKPALGVTEPGAIAYAVSTARTYARGEVLSLVLNLNSGIYKNAYTCGIPNSSHLGNFYAAALGLVAGKPEKGLESLADVTEEDNTKAEKLVIDGIIQVNMTEITSRIFIEAVLRTTEGEAAVTIRDSHTNIVKIRVNGKIILDKEETGSAATSDVGAVLASDGVETSGGAAESRETTSEMTPADSPSETPLPDIHDYTLAQLYDYITTVDAAELDFIREAYRMNYQLFAEGLHSSRTCYAAYLLKKNGGRIISADAQKTASLLCNAAIEARVMGLDKPAMSITGSGAHGIIATLPLYGEMKVHGLSEESLLRATALSYLVCMYIKEYSGKLSAFCGCGIAAGSGMACGLVYLRGGGVDAMARCLNNMASGITGMICDGGNKGCTMKGIVAVDSAFQSAELALNGIFVDNEHGINGNTPEDTMHNMGLIASPGMVGTEKVIVEIMNGK